MAVPYCHAAAPVAVTSSRLATSQPFARRSNPTRDETFPKSARLLKPVEYRKVYDQGWRYTCAIFTAFCLHTGSDSETRFGFTLPRAVGKANVRNRIKRRMRETVRRMRSEFPLGYWVVLNPRRAAFDAPIENIQRELERVASRCRR
jgi:ribonuclease P protein component